VYYVYEEEEEYTSNSSSSSSSNEEFRPRPPRLSRPRPPLKLSSRRLEEDVFPLLLGAFFTIFFSFLPLEKNLTFGCFAATTPCACWSISTDSKPTSFMRLTMPRTPPPPATLLEGSPV